MNRSINGWPPKPLEGLGTDITLGVNVVKRPSGEQPIIRTADLRDRLSLIEVDPESKLSVPESRSLTNALVEPGDVVIVGRGGGHRVGLVGVLADGDVQPAIAGNLIRIRCDGERLLGPVLALYLSTPQGTAEVEKLSRSSTLMMSLRASDLLQLQVPVPPLHVQEEIARLVLAGSEAWTCGIEAANVRHDMVMAHTTDLLLRTEDEEIR